MKEIKLKCGIIVKIDERDSHIFDEYIVMYHRGYVICRKHGDRKKRNIPLGRLILGIDNEQGIMVDHRDHDTLNYCRYNLRPATNSQNQMNRSKRNNCTSIYKGVTWRARQRKWHSYIKKDNKYFHVGVFENEIEAAIAYDKKAIELFGEYALLNFFDQSAVQ